MKWKMLNRTGLILVYALMAFSSAGADTNIYQLVTKGRPFELLWHRRGEAPQVEARAIVYQSIDSSGRWLDEVKSIDIRSVDMNPMRSAFFPRIDDHARYRVEVEYRQGPSGQWRKVDSDGDTLDGKTRRWTFPFPDKSFLLIEIRLDKVS